MNWSRFCAALTVLCTAILLCSPARADDAPDVLTTAADAAGHIGKTATVEFTAVAVKHSHRRKVLFITSTDNPRSPAGLLAMIQETDLPHFDAKNKDDLAKRLVGQRIRVRGAIARDEEQIVVRLTSGKQITVVAATVAAPPPGDIVVTVEERQPQSVTACNLAKLPQEKLTIERDGQKETYSGISLAAVLRHTGVTLGHEARDRYLTRYVLVTSSDGYRALLSIGEVDPYLRKSHVLLADKLDGRPLDPSDGPWRLIIPDDVRRRRWVRAVERIEVRYADVSHTPP